MKRTLAFLLALCLIFGQVPAAVFAVEPGTAPEETAEHHEEPEVTAPPAEEEAVTVEASSGTCGENLTWTLSDDGVLTISGTGLMEDFSYSSSVPWYNFRTSISSVIIDDGVTSIGIGAFFGCTNLCIVTIGNNVNNIGMNAFSDCPSLSSVTIGNSVTSIDQGAFYACSSLSSVTIPDSVISIGRRAFYRCSSLSSLTIGNSVASIGDGAFDSCISLSGVIIPDSVTSIGDSAFDHCDSLDNVTIGNSVIIIGNSAFNNCDSLTSVTIPASVTSVGVNAFSNCDYLTEITFHGNAPSLLTDAFYGVQATAYYPTNNYTWTEEIMQNYGGTITWMPSTMSVIVDSGTCGNNLTWELTDNGLLTISGMGAMWDYSHEGAPWYSSRSNITHLVIEDGVTSIGDSAFYCCTSLSRVTIGDSVTSIGDSAFYYCDSLTSMTIGNSVTSIGECAFIFCYRLISLIIGDSVIIISGRAFMYCEGLISVTIGNSVTSIGDLAFYYCDRLNEITFRGDAPNISSDAFGNVSATSCYPDGNPTWNADVMQNYGGTITWVPYNAEECNHEWELMATEAPSCEESGSEMYCCALCGEWDNVFLQPLGHDYENNVCTRCEMMEYVVCAYTKELDLTISTDEELRIGWVLYHEKEPMDSWEEPVFAIGDPNVIRAVECTKAEIGYILTIKGLCAGTTSLTATDGASGASVTIEVTVGKNTAVSECYLITEVPRFYPNNTADDHLLTNFYNCNGLYVRNFPDPQEIKLVNGQYHLEFDVYNEKAMYGSVDVYNEKDEWIRSQRINKYTGIHGLWDAIEGAWYLVADASYALFGPGNMLSYESHSISKHTHISIDVPEGGYFVISNNIVESEGVYIYNMIDLIMLTATGIIDLVYDSKNVESVQEMTIDQLLSSSEFIKIFRDEFENIGRNVSQSYITAGYGEIAKSCTMQACEILEASGVDWKGTIASCTGIAEEVVKKLTLHEIGIALDVIFGIQKATDYFLQIAHFTDSGNQQYIVLHTP